jgi:hypothetical protein
VGQGEPDGNDWPAPRQRQAPRRDRSSAIEAKIAMVLLDKSMLLRVKSRPEIAIDLYDDIQVRFSLSDRSEVREQVAKALLKKTWGGHPHTGRID